MYDRNQVLVKRLPTAVCVKDFIEGHAANYEEYLTDFVNASKLVEEKNGEIFSLRNHSEQSSGESDIYNDFYDLDKNVIYYAKYGKSKIREKECCCWNQDKIKQEGELFQYVKNTYRYAGFLDITPYDVRGVGFYIGRVIIPELIPLYLPSSIPQKHPRFQEYEVINYDPHPMP